MEVSGAGSCPRAVNNETSLRSDGGGRGRTGQLSPCPPHTADLERTLHRVFVYVFPGTFQRCVLRLFEAHLARQMYAARARQKAEGLFLSVEKFLLTLEGHKVDLFKCGRRTSAFYTSAVG